MRITFRSGPLLGAIFSLTVAALTAPASAMQPPTNAPGHNEPAASAAADQVFDAAMADYEVGDARLPAARAGFERACDLGIAEGCYYLGFMLENGQGGPDDPARARSLYTKACDGNDDDGCYFLGRMLEEGLGGPADVVRAETVFRKACKLGAQEACIAAASM